MNSSSLTAMKSKGFQGRSLPMTYNSQSTSCCCPSSSTDTVYIRGPPGPTGSIIDCGYLYRGVTANTPENLPTDVPAGTLGLVICTSVIFEWDGVAWVLIEQPSKPLLFFDINSNEIYTVYESTPEGCTGSTLYTCGDATLFINTDNNIIYECAGNNTWDEKCQLKSITGPQGPQGVKSFVIDHPTDESRYLVHGCLEGPEAGVYYRGKAEITESAVIIRVPQYVPSMAKDFTVQITPIRSIERTQLPVYEVSEVENGSFTVYGPPGKFFWHVHGSRGYFDIEPRKTTVELKGNGPYKWI
jgi:hypothetical protein